MQITRSWPRSFPRFSYSVRTGLTALALLTLFCPTAPAAPTPPVVNTVSPETSLTGWLLASSVMMQRGDVNAAYTALSQATLLNPHDLKLKNDALHYAAMSAHEEAAVSLANTLSNNDIATLILAQNAVANSRWADLRHILNRDSHQGPLVSVAAPILLAWAEAEEGHINQALSRLDAASSAPPTRRLYQFHAALIAEHLPTPQRALAFYKKTGTSSNDPLTLQILYAQRYAGVLKKAGQDHQSTDAISALAHTSPLADLIIAPLQKTSGQTKPLTPRQGAAILNLQLALMLTDIVQQQNLTHDPIIIALQQALTLDPTLTTARIFLADTFRETDQITNGLQTLDAISSTDPLAALAAQERVNLASRSHDLPLQADALHRALILAPGNPQFLVQLANVEDQLGHHTAAVDLYSQALTASPPRREIIWPILLGRAMAEQENSDLTKMHDDMDHLLQLAPDQPEVLNFIGYASIERDENQERALTLLRHAVELQPDDPSIQDSYAWALLKYKGDIKTALPMLVQAAERATNDPEIGYHLGVAYWYLGRHTEAQDQWNQSLNDNPLPQDKTLLQNALKNSGPHLPAFEQKK